MTELDLAIIGGGPAGMSAAISAYESGIKNIMIFEREENLGGILKQCIHNGFGLHKFSEELTGPEYAARYEKRVRELDIPTKLSTTVLDITKDKVITATNDYDGIFTVKAKAIILAMGCRERPKGALNIPGHRPAGIYSAGTAQKFVNIKGYMPGKNVVILGSGDIGLIMARRMTLEGAKVHAVCEVMPYSGGLARNIEQCLNDFNIPLLLSHTVTDIHGKDRLTGVTISQVDENRRPIEGTSKYIECDTLLLSVGLIPENELSLGAGIKMSPVTNGAEVDQDRQTSIDGVFACGNVLHVHDLVDYVSEEAEVAGKAAADYILSGSSEKTDKIPVKPDGKVRYTVPQYVSKTSVGKKSKVYFRVSDVYKNISLVVKNDTGEVLSKAKKVSLAPGSMEHFTVTEDMLQSTSYITVSLEEN